MELWNDFEGKVVADQFRLGRLLAPKGRSAFFAATGARGEAVTLRLIESLNDEDEILARWGRVRSLEEEHLVGMQACGQTMLDGTHLVYAVLEATDADLSEVLRERPLTVDETRAMASSVLAGIEALHAAGLVHEHVEAASVLARGEVIKLRSDCVREAPEGAEGEALRRRDTRDFAVLVGYALTQRRDPAQGMVPRQFEDLVRNGVSGTWGLKEMAALLRPAAPIGVAAAGRTPGSGANKPAAAAPVPSTAGVLPAAVHGGAAPAGVGAGRRVPGSAAAGPMLLGSRGAAAGAAGVLPVAANGGTAAGVMAAEAAPVATGKVAVAEDGARAEGRSYSPSAVATALEADAGEGRLPVRGLGVERATERAGLATEEGRRRLVPLAVVGAIALLLLVIWYFVRARPAAPAAVPANAVQQSAPVPQAKPSAASTSRGPGVPARAARPAATAAVAAAPSTGEVWRVVVATYGRQEQAQERATQIASRHPQLVPEVYTPTGRAPYLVTVGGWMSAAQAQTERARARREGLPRDTYAQNYHGR